jgi:hypothetical protein
MAWTYWVHNGTEWRPVGDSLHSAITWMRVVRDTPHRTPLIGRIALTRGCQLPIKTST